MSGSPGGSERPTGPQTGAQFAAERSAALDIERLINHLVRHTHRLIIGEVQRQAMRDLLRTPALPPAPILPRSVTPPTPRDIWTRDTPVRPLHRPGKPVLHIGPQLRVHRKLRRLGSTGATLRMRLSGRGSILNPAASNRSVALQLPGDRGWRTTELTRDLAHPGTAGQQDRDLLPLGERQITPRRRGEGERRHAATLAKPPDTNAGQHSRLDRSLKRHLARRIWRLLYAAQTAVAPPRLTTHSNPHIATFT
jgi:hypothetical protein